MKSKIKLRYLIYAFVVIFPICIVAYHSVPQSTIYLYSSTFSDNPKTSLNIRVETYKAVFQDFINNPLFGVGMGNSEGGIGFPHNIILEVMAELGLVGLFIFLCLFFVTIYKSLLYIRHCSDKEPQLLMKISLVLFTYSFLVLMAGDRIVTAIGFFLPMGIISSLVKQKPFIKGTS
jgi:O-antigen ligase